MNLSNKIFSILFIMSVMIAFAQGDIGQRFSRFSKVVPFELSSTISSTSSSPFTFYSYTGRDSIFGYVVELTEKSKNNWMRLFFSQASLPQGYIFRITSLTDGYQQHFNQQTLTQWKQSTAFFNGHSVFIQCLKDLTQNQNIEEQKPILVIESIMFDESKKQQSEEDDKESSAMSICFDPDTRTFTNDTNQGRYIYDNPNGCCTAWMIDDDNHCFLSAGHCTDIGKGLVEFNVPLSASDGTLIHPPPEDQYIVDQESMQTKYSGEASSDWRYFGVFPNSETGLTPIEVYGGNFYRLQRVREYPVSGTALRITGYGENEDFPLEHRRVLKTAIGTFKSNSLWALSYRVDTSNGNSGSAIYNIETGYAIGIHTLGGCSASNSFSANSGVDIFSPSLQDALASPRGICQRSRNQNKI